MFAAGSNNLNGVTASATAHNQQHAHHLHQQQMQQQHVASATVLSDAAAHDLHTFKEALVLRPRLVFRKNIEIMYIL